MHPAKQGDWKNIFFEFDKQTGLNIFESQLQFWAELKHCDWVLLFKLLLKSNWFSYEIRVGSWQKSKKPA